MKKIIIILVIFSINLFGKIIDSHPRVYVNDSLKAILKGYVANNTPEWVALKDYCDNNINKDLETGYQGQTWAKAARNYAMAYLVTGNEDYGKAACKYISGLVFDNWNGGTLGDGEKIIDIKSVDQGYSTRSVGMALNCARDWVDGSVSLTQTLIDSAHFRMKQWLESADGRAWHYNIPTCNYFSGFFGMVYTYIAFYGDSGFDDKWVSRAEDMWKNELLPALNGDLKGGDWYEGWNYGPTTYERNIYYCRLRELGTDEDNHYDDTKIYDEAISLAIHSLYPSRAYYTDWGSWSGTNKGDPRKQLVLAMIGLPATDPTLKQIGKWYLNHLEWFERATRPDEWKEFLFTDPSITELEPTIDNMGSLCYQSNMIKVVSRSDEWSNKDATFIDIQAHKRSNNSDETYGDAQTNMAKGAFKLASRGELLLTDGCTWEREGKYHNIALVTGDHYDAPGQDWWYSNGSDLDVTVGNNDYIYTYVKMKGLENLYNDNRSSDKGTHPSLSFYSRSILFLKPDIVVCYDNIQALTSNNHVSFRWYLNGLPTVSDQEAVLKVNNAALFMKTFDRGGAFLSPEAAPKRRGMYYLDYTPKNDGLNNQTITLFEAADSKQTNMCFAAILETKDDKIAGLHISDDCADWVSVFTTDKAGENINGNIEYTFEPRTSITNHFITDLPQGGYSISITGNAKKTLLLNASGNDYMVDTKGMLIFSSTSNNEIVELVGCSGSAIRKPKEPTNLKIKK